MNTRKNHTFAPNVDPSTGEVCNTLFIQGNGESQVKRTLRQGGRPTRASTGETMYSIGKNGLAPLDTIYYPVVGDSDLADVDLNPFKNFFSVLNPIKVIAALKSSDRYQSYGIQVSGFNPANGQSVAYHSINFSEYSIGQISDIESHYKLYKAWLNMKGEDKKEGLILYGESRGTAAIFCSLTHPAYKSEYKNIRLVVLEGAVDSISNVIVKRFGRFAPLATHALNFFHKHKMIKYDNQNGPSPISTVQDFPENIPVVFVTSKKDTVVSPENTRNIAWALAKQKKNDVFLLELEHSTHGDYMFDDKEDHDRYEQFIHAVYEKYHLAHKPELAAKGREFLEICRLDPDKYEQEFKNMDRLNIG